METVIVDQIGFAISALYLTCLLVPFCCYCISQLYRHRKQMFMVKRGVKTTFTFTISHLTFIICFDILLFALWFDATLLGRVAFFMLFPAIGMCGYCLTCKTWMVLYDYKWTYFTLEIEWTSIINSTFHSTNWYLKNRKTFGNWSWMAKFWGLIYVIAFTAMYLSVLMIFSGDTILTISGIICFTIPLSAIWCTYITIFYRTPNLQKISDRFFIHWESKLMAKMGTALSIITFVMFAVSGASLMMFPSASDIIAILAALIFPSLSASTVYSCTALIIKKNITLCNGDHDVSVSSRQAILATRPASGTNNMTAILGDNDALHLFMLHLSCEYSMELLLAFIEFSQYLEYLEERSSTNSEQNASPDLDSFILSDSVPLSSIVENTHKEHGFKLKAYELYYKYIARGSEYEINISGRLRNQCAHLMQNDQVFLNANVIVSDIEPLFKQCNQELLRYLSYSHSRFAKTEEYAAVLKIITPPDS
eukprot:378920_1